MATHRRTSKPRCGLIHVALWLIASGAALPDAPSNAPRGEAVEFQASGVNLRMEHGIVIGIDFMRGRMEPLEPGKPVTFDDVNSFDVRVSFARVAITTGTLANIMNHYAFAYPGAPLKNVAVEARPGGRLRIKGTMHKGVDVTFSMEGRPEPDKSGDIRLHADKLSSAHLPVKGLLHLFGEDLAKLVNLNEARGIRMEGDDVILFPSRVTPAPHLLGRVTRVVVEGNRIIETFGAERDAQRLSLPHKARNYMYHRGGTLRFGKLTMADADLEIVELNPTGAFEFSLPDYNRQLVAGYSKNTPNHGLIVYMPDYSSIVRK